jgi:hypothetical protein
MRSTLTFASMAMITLGCGYEGSTGSGYPTGTPATITVSATTTDLLVSAGETRTLSAVVRDGAGTLLAAPTLTWRTSAPNVATVSGSGESATVTAVDDGTAVITASIGAVEGTFAVVVRRRIESIEISAPDSVVVAGTTMQLTVVGRDGRQQPIPALPSVTFTSSNEFSILVSSDGLVTALFSPFQPLTSVLTATVTRDGRTVSATKPVKVGSAAPPVFDFGSLLLTEAVRPDPVPGLGVGIGFLTLQPDRVQYKVLWSSLTGPPLVAHLHGPDSDDGIAPVLVELSLGSGRDTHGVATGSFSAADIRGTGGNPAISLDSLVTLMRTPAAVYVDVHTARFVDGEVRGAIVGTR